jgi:transcriptional regulator with XRE-family HTH domain
MPDENRPALVPDWTLGWRLQRALSHAGISVQEIADVLQVSRTTISRWINDKGAPPRPIYVKEWSLKCGVDYGWLATGEEPEENISAARATDGHHVKMSCSSRAVGLAPVILLSPVNAAVEGCEMQGAA